MCPKFERWLQTGAAKFEFEPIQSLLSNKMAQANFMMQLGTFPKLFFENQIEKILLKEEFEKLKEEEYVDKLSNEWKDWLKKYSQALKSSKLSSEERLKLMKENNPSFVLRNYILENSIKEAEKGKYDQVNTLLKLSLDPYNREYMNEESYKHYYDLPPKWAQTLCVSCSS